MTTETMPEKHTGEPETCARCLAQANVIGTDGLTPNESAPFRVWVTVERFDDDPKTSRVGLPDDRGAWVAAWVWVEFEDDE